MADNNNDDDYYEDPDTTTSIGAGYDVGYDKGKGTGNGISGGINALEPNINDPRQGTITGGDWEPWHEDPPSTLTGLTPDGGTPYSTFQQLTKEALERGKITSQNLKGGWGDYTLKDAIEAGLISKVDAAALDPEVGIGRVEPGGLLASILGADPQGRFNIGWRDQDFPDYNPNYADMMFPTQSMKEAYGFNPDTGTWADTQLQGMFSRDITGRQLGEIGRQAQAFDLTQDQMGQLAGLVGAPVTDVTKEFEFDVAEKLGGAKSYAQALGEGYTVDEIKNAQEGAEAAARALGRSEDYEPYAQAYSGYLSKGLKDFFSKDEIGYGRDAPTPIDVVLSTSGGKFVRDPSYVKQIREGLENFSNVAGLIPNPFTPILAGLTGLANLYNYNARLGDRQFATRRANMETRRAREKPFQDAFNRGLINHDQYRNAVTSLPSLPAFSKEGIPTFYDVPSLWGDISSKITEGISSIPDRLGSAFSSVGIGGKGFSFKPDYDPKTNLFVGDETSETRKKVKKSWTYERKRDLAKKLGKDIDDLTDEDYEKHQEFDIVEVYSKGGEVGSLREIKAMPNNNQKTITDSINMLNQFAQTGTTGLMGVGNIIPTPPMLPQVLDREVATGGDNEDALRSLIMEDVESYGGGAVSGEGDGTSDEIEAVIQEDVVMAAGGGGLSALAGPSGKLDNYLPQVSKQGGQAARLSDGEFVIPADVVASIGNGSTAAGNKELYNLMSKVRKIKTGDADQPRDMPASPAELLGIG